MALSLTVNLHQVWGSRRVKLVTLAFDSSYPTGGEALPTGTTTAKFGLSKVDFVIIPTSAGYTFAYDYTNDKILAYYGDNNNAADGPAIEVPNTTDLSALTSVRAFVVGY
jgi:hypothetical protein